MSVVSDATLDRARAGDERAFREATEPFRRELQLHCYRITGSIQDAEDLVQETLLAAWRGLPGFAGRSSLRAWLYRIATNRALNLLRDGGRRPRTAEEPPTAYPAADSLGRAHVAGALPGHAAGGPAGWSPWARRALRDQGGRLAGLRQRASAPRAGAARRPDPA